MASKVNWRPRRLMLRNSGVVWVSMLSSNVLMGPIWVRVPVSTTMPVACPAATSVPDHAMP